uniref:Uncharacterized protein n=1 Tax=Aegilops tauschii subsp. strangulata TaxID=200361 RepID=A0A453J476_AEGTS
ALGRAMTRAEAAWLRYSASMPDHLLYCHNVAILLLLYTLAPLPLALLELRAPGHRPRLAPHRRRAQPCLLPGRQDGRHPHGAAAAVGRGGGGADAGLPAGGGLPRLLDPQAAAHQVGLRQHPPRPPRVHGALRIRRALRALGRGPHPRRPRVHRPRHRALPHDHPLALVPPTPPRGHRHPQRV